MHCGGGGGEGGGGGDGGGEGGGGDGAGGGEGGCHDCSLLVTSKRISIYIYINRQQLRKGYRPIMNLLLLFSIPTF